MRGAAMALAIRMQDLVDGGIASDYAELARLNQVTRARITQIMNLLLLEPEIQEVISNLAGVEFVDCSELAKQGGVLNCISWNIREPSEL